VTALVVAGIATGGDGVGRLPDGLTVFIPRTVPGDRVEVEMTERRRRWGRARVLRILEPGPGRTAPRCPHYDQDECGGCQLQHLTLPAQHEAKRTVVQQVLRRVGGRDVPLPALTPAPTAWRYRSKITLAIRDGHIGFHRYDRPGAVFDLADCHVAAPELMPVLSAVRHAAGLLPPGVDRVVLRLDREGGRHAVVHGGTPPWDARRFAAGLGDEVGTIWWEPEGGAVRAVAGRHGGFPALAFQQVHPAVAELIRARAVAWLGAGTGQVAWDLYGGVGDSARLLAASGARVTSVDADRTAVAWARRQPAGEASAPTFLAGRVEEVLHRLPGPDVVLLNPPRQGAAPRVTAALERLRSDGLARRVAYVSCDPATLARDLARLPGYAVHAVETFDMFPQTAHVETLALLEAA